MGKFIESEIIKVKAPNRAPGSILRRTDFKNYLNGHGTFYQFDKDHFPDDLLSAKKGNRLSLVLYNLHTDQLDEIIFKLDTRSKISETCIWLNGYIDNTKHCFAIKIRYYIDRPLKSKILVYASALPDYDCFSRL